jgi:hypothetical protein
MKPIARLLLSLACLALNAGHATAGLFYANTSPANVPWPGGVIPYLFDPGLTSAETNTYLHGLREWELAANVQFVPRSNQTQYILFKYDPNGPNRYSGANPQVVEVNSLSRAQVGHEMGHSLGLHHENVRPDQSSRLLVLTNNIWPGQEFWFIPDLTGVVHGQYDFESVMHLGRNFASIDPAHLDTQQARPGYERYQSRMGNHALSPGDRAAVAYLYGPPVAPPTNVVTTTRDFGPGSLRAALYYAMDHPGTTIRFNLPPSDAGYSNGVWNIQLTGHLPPLVADGTVIDGGTQPGFAGRPLVFVDGSAMLPPSVVGYVSGLLVYAANCSVKQLAFTGLNWNALTLLYADATNNTIAGCWCGLDATGTNRAPNAAQGILIAGGASRNVIGGTTAAARNVLSGNAQYGFFLTDANTTGNTILGNYIGTDFSGSLAVSNATGGAFLGNGARSNLVGGATAAARNVFSGNHGFGLWLGGAGPRHNTVRGNFFGLNAAGSAAVPNTFAGMHLIDGAVENLVAANVFSGNANEGLRVSGADTTGNVVQGNFCGTSPDGTAAIPNGFGGLIVMSGAWGNLIGGLTPAARNVCSGNGTVGLAVGDGAHGNVVQGNFCGTDASGNGALGNGFAGAYLTGAHDNFFGGTVPGAGNLLSGNGTYGLFVAGPDTLGNLIQGNFIGTRADGSNALANGWIGVVFYSAASDNVLGLAPDGSGAGNIIAHHYADAVRVADADTAGNRIRGNTCFDNGGLSINLLGGTEDWYGVTANDAGDSDEGPNQFQNFPELTEATAYPASATVAGTLRSKAARFFVVDVHRDPAEHSSEYGVGRFHAGSTTVTTDGSGYASFSVSVPGSFAGQYFSATATDYVSGDTSEFGPALLAETAPAPPSFVGPISLTSTGFVARLAVTPGQSYRVQAATNLGVNPVIWTTLTNFVAATASRDFLDTDATNRPLRFYRVISP